MPQHLKPTPERYCQSCGKKLERKLFGRRYEDLAVFKRRKYCNQKCMVNGFRVKPHVGKSWYSLHSYARKLVPPGSCAICGEPNASDVHHKDGNIENNVKENLVRLCRGCHMMLHHRKKPCRICGRPQKGHGLCGKHLQRFKKYGNPLISNGKLVTD